MPWPLNRHDKQVSSLFQMPLIKILSLTSTQYLILKIIITALPYIDTSEFTGPIIYPWWRHQMEKFPRYWPFVWGIHRSPVNSPHKGQWRGALVFSLMCAWINGWVNNREAGDLRRHRAHYDVIATPCDVCKVVNIEMKGQSEIAYLPKFANIMLIVMVIVINEIF